MPAKTATPTQQIVLEPQDKKIRPVRGQTSPFNASGRDDPNLQKKLYGEGRMLSPGPVFYPRRTQVEKNSKALAYMVPPETLTNPRRKPTISPICQLLGKECNFKNRHLIRKAVKANLNLEKIKRSPEGKKKKLLINGLHKLVQHKPVDPQPANESMRSVVETSASQVEKASYPIIPHEKRYQNVKKLG